VRHAEQDRHFADKRTRLVEYGDLGAAAQNFDTAFHKHIYAAGVLALFQYDGSACHVFQGNGTAVVEDGAHQPVFTFPGKLRPEMSFACRLSSNPSAER